MGSRLLQGYNILPAYPIRYVSFQAFSPSCTMERYLIKIASPIYNHKTEGEGGTVAI